MLTLIKKPMNVSDIAYKLQVTFRVVSKHLQVLENAELVIRQRTGNFVYYRVHTGNKELKGLINYLKTLKNNK
jgi:DNA-binding transcriptional ArsR family regulator